MIAKSDLDIIGDLFVASSNTSVTIKNKDYQWNIFTDFCKTYSETPVPVKPETLVRYAVFLIVQRNCRENTVRNHLSTIRRYHKLYLNIDIPSPLQYAPLEAVLKGGAKYIGRTVKQKYPVTANILSALVLTLPHDSPYKTLYNLLFFGLPRVGNVIPYSGRKFSAIKHLTWDNIEYSDTGVIITLQVTKTIQNFERVLRIPIADSPERPEFCVKTGLKLLKRLQNYPVSKFHPVFNLYE